MAEQRTLAPRDLVVRAADRAGMEEECFRHPLNANSELHGFELGRKVGLRRVGVNLLRVPPRRESYAFHSHAAEEEWMYVLSGHGIAEIGNETFEIGAGDFVGFPAGCFAHHVRNPHDEPLVYLCGGEVTTIDVADFPRSGRRVVRTGREVVVYPVSAGEPLFGPGQRHGDGR